MNVNNEVNTENAQENNLNRHMQDMLAYACYRSKRIIDKASGELSVKNNKYDINLSDIETELIKAAASCRRYASDLFIDWYAIRDEIIKKEDGPKVVYYAEGFREFGIDGNNYIYSNLCTYKHNHKKLDKHYNMIYAIKIEKTEDDVIVTVFDIKDSIVYYDKDDRQDYDRLSPRDAYIAVYKLTSQNAMLVPTTNLKCDKFNKLYFILGNKLIELINNTTDEEMAEKLNNNLCKINQIVVNLINSDINHTPYIRENTHLESMVEDWYHGRFECECINDDEIHNELFLSYIKSISWIRKGDKK